MFMKRTFLLIGIIAFLLCFFHSFYLELCILTILSLFIWKSYKKKTIFIFFILVIFVLCKNNEDIYIPKSDILEIIEIHTNYCLGKDEENHIFVLYNIKQITIGDILQVEGKYEKIHSSNNRNTYSFKTTMQHKNIKYQMFVVRYEKIADSISIQGKIYNHIQNIKNKTVKTKLNQTFYQINEEEVSHHFINMSGMHIMFLAYLLSKYFASYKICSLVLCILYNLFFPTAIFITRIFVINIIDLVFIKGNNKEKLGLSIIILLFKNPYFAYDIGFLLTILFRFAYCFNISHLSNRKIQFLILFPIQLYFFHEFYFLSFFFFTGIRYLSGIYLLLCLLSIFFTSVHPILLFFSKIRNMIEIIYDNPAWIIGKPNFIWLICWILLFLFVLHKAQKKHYLYALILIIFQFQCNNLHLFNEVTFLDVGQGDCILIQEAWNGKTILIDVAGHKKRNIPKRNIYPYLKSRGIKKIDTLIITHDDYDHSGGLKELKELIDIHTIVSEEKDLILKNGELKIIKKIKKYEDKNDNSLIYYSEIDGIQYLFMGDASILREKEILDAYNLLQADVIKIGHHGSNTSSSLSFLTQIHPLISVISSGKNNYYNHPHQEVLENIKAVDSLVLNTQTNGSISIFSNGFIKFMITGADEFAIIRK